MISARLDKKTRTRVLCGATTDGRYRCRGELGELDYDSPTVGGIIRGSDGSSLLGAEVVHEKCPRCGEENVIDPERLIDAWRLFTTL
jgi:hypothetical protein